MAIPRTDTGKGSNSQQSTSRDNCFIAGWRGQMNRTMFIGLTFFLKHTFILRSHIIHRHTTPTYSVSFTPVETDLWIEMPWILICC